MAFLAAEDESGEVEIVVFPKIHAQSGSKIEENSVLVFIGNAELKEVYGNESEENVTILLKSVLTPEEAINTIKGAQQPKSFSEKSLYIKATESNEHCLNDAISLASKSIGNSRILVYFEKEKRLCAAKGQTTQINERLLLQLKQIMGEENIAVK